MGRLTETRISMDDRTGRCISCGFLGARTLYPGLLEVQSWHRAQPALEFHVSARTPSVTVAAELMCYRRVTSLREEVEQIETAKELSRGEATELVLNRERHCEKWCEYEPAFDPKEHLVESKARQLDQDRKLERAGHRIRFIGIDHDFGARLQVLDCNTHTAFRTRDPLFDLGSQDGEIRRPRRLRNTHDQDAEQRLCSSSHKTSLGYVPSCVISRLLPLCLCVFVVPHRRGNR